MNNRSRRRAEILAQDATSITVAAAYLRPIDRRSLGYLAFVCPVCGHVHKHLAVGSINGNDNKHILPGCVIPWHTNFLNHHLLSSLHENWHFHLYEVTDPTRAGDFPRRLRNRLASRAAKAGA